MTWCDAQMMTSRFVPALVSFLAGALVWAAWLSWGFDDDHAYSVPQVIGCGVSAVVVVIGLVLVFRGVRSCLVSLATTLGLTLAWTVWAARGEGNDGDGLYVVGTMMLLVGAGVGLSVVELLTRAVLRRQRVSSEA